MKFAAIVLLLLGAAPALAEEPALKPLCDREFTKDASVLVPAGEKDVLAMSTEAEDKPSIALVSVTDGKVKKRLDFGKEWTSMVATDDVGTRLALAGPDGEIAVCDLVGKDAPKKFKVTGKLNQLRLSSDGKLLLALSDKKLMELWDLTTGEKQEIPVLEKELRWVAVSKNGLVASRSSEGVQANLFDSKTGKQPKGPTYRDPNPPAIDFSDAPLSQLEFSRDGTRLLSVDCVGGVNLWDCDNGKKTLKLDTIGSAISILSAHLSPDNSWMVTSQLDGTVAVWDVKSGRVMCQEKAYPEMQPGRFVRFLGPATFATCSDPGFKVIVWEYSPGK